MCALPFYRQGDHQEDGRPFQKPFQGPVNLHKHRWGYSSSDHPRGPGGTTAAGGSAGVREQGRMGGGSCGERVWRDGYIPVVAVFLQKKETSSGQRLSVL